MTDMSNWKTAMDLRPEVVIENPDLYPVVGNLLSFHDANEIFSEFKGRMRYGECMAKSLIAARFLSCCTPPMRLSIVMGDMSITWIDKRGGVTQYGFAYEPPFEYHTWIECPEGIIDFSLPGVIERANFFEDEHGKFLDGLVPFILASHRKEVPPWLNYHRRKTVKMLQELS